MSKSTPESTGPPVLIQRQQETGEAESKRRRMDIAEIARLENLERELHYVASQSVEFSILACKTAADILHEPASPQSLTKTATATTQHQARLRELEGLEEMDTFQEVYENEIELPEGDRVVTGRWVDTEIADLHKARFVLKGFQQNVVEDLYAGTVSAVTVRLMLSLCASRRSEGWECYVADVSKAFLHSDIGERPVFCKPPPEWRPKVCTNRKRGGVIWQLKKALYGLKTSPKRWLECLTAAMTEVGLHQTLLEGTVYVGRDVIICAHVDDLLCVGRTDRVEEVLGELQQRLRMKVEKVQSSMVYLGRRLTRTKKGYTYGCDESYVDRMLAGLGWENMSPSQNLAAMDSPRDEADATPIEDEAMQKMYREAIGRLHWLDRVDTRLPVSLLASASGRASACDVRNLKKVMKYLSGTKDVTARIEPVSVAGPKPGADGDILVHSDSDWAGSKESRRSTSGAAVYVALAGRWFFVQASTRRQVSVALSSAEAELAAAVAATTEAIGIRQLYRTMSDQEPTIADPVRGIVIAMDAMAAVQLLRRKGCSKRMRHVEIRAFYMQDLVARGLTIHKVGTLEMAADTLTKWMPLSAYHKAALALADSDEVGRSGAKHTDVHHVEVHVETRNRVTASTVPGAQTRQSPIRPDRAAESTARNAQAWSPSAQKHRFPESIARHARERQRKRQHRMEYNVFTVKDTDVYIDNADKDPRAALSYPGSPKQRNTAQQGRRHRHRQERGWCSGYGGYGSKSSSGAGSRSRAPQYVRGGVQEWPTQWDTRRTARGARQEHLGMHASTGVGRRRPTGSQAKPGASQRRSRPQGGGQAGTQAQRKQATHPVAFA